jgi:hypothetical protein
MPARREPRPPEGNFVAIERGGQHGRKPMLRPPSTSAGTPSEDTRQLTLTARLYGSSYLLCVGKRWPSRNYASDKSRLRPSNCLQLIEEHCVFAVRGRAGMLGLRVWANNDN